MTMMVDFWYEFVHRDILFLFLYKFSNYHRFFNFFKKLKIRSAQKLFK